MQGTRVVFTSPNQVRLEEFTLEADCLKPDEALIRTHYSLISPGTELACLRGTESWAPLPFVPGYAGCGEVLAAGPEAGVAPGEIVFSYTKHASIVTGSRLMMRPPDGLDLRVACFARMAAVSITALRVSQAELGDHVAVIGLGLVGNLCAQLLQLAGCEVIGLDVSARRVEIARACGLRHALDVSAIDRTAAVRDLTGGRMCNVVVEATGVPALAAEAGELCAKNGEVVLLGTPRGSHRADVTPLLERIHLWGNGCITYKGAHEWRYPVRHDPSGWAKHSIERNVEVLFRLLARGDLNVQPLISHVLSPQEAPQSYAGLREQPDAYLGVLFDWTRA